MTDDTMQNRTELAPVESDVQARRDFLAGLGKWSMSVIGGVALAGMIGQPMNALGAGAWANRRGIGGGAWANSRLAPGGGGAWANGRVAGGGAWANGRVVGGGGGAWANSRGIGGGGAWANRRF